jgi:hypothetical protein
MYNSSIVWSRLLVQMMVVFYSLQQCAMEDTFKLCLLKPYLSCIVTHGSLTDITQTAVQLQ